MSSEQLQNQNEANSQPESTKLSRKEQKRLEDPDLDAFGVMGLFTDNDYKEITYEYGNY